MPRKSSAALHVDPLLVAWEGSQWKLALDAHMDVLTKEAKKGVALSQLEGTAPTALVRAPPFITALTRSRPSEDADGRVTHPRRCTLGTPSQRRYANGYIYQVTVLLRRSVLNLRRQGDRLMWNYLINIANFLFLGIFFLGLRVSVRGRWTVRHGPSEGADARLRNPATGADARRRNPATAGLVVSSPTTSSQSWSFSRATPPSSFS